MVEEDTELYFVYVRGQAGSAHQSQKIHTYQLSTTDVKGHLSLWPVSLLFTFHLLFLVNRGPEHKCSGLWRCWAEARRTLLPCIKHWNFNPENVPLSTRFFISCFLFLLFRFWFGSSFFLFLLFVFWNVTYIVLLLFVKILYTHIWKYVQNTLLYINV